MERLERRDFRPTAPPVMHLLEANKVKYILSDPVCRIYGYSVGTGLRQMCNMAQREQKHSRFRLQLVFG